MRSATLLFAILATTACASGGSSPAPAPDRVLVVDTDGRVLRQSTGGEIARAVFAAPVAKVWPAVALAYTDLGIQPTDNDRATGRYGNAGFVVPRRIMGRNIAEFFSCGSSMTGLLVDAGRVNGNVMSTVVDDGTGGTAVMTHVTGTLRRNDGTSTDPVVCASTGAYEEAIRQGIQKHLGTP